MNPIEIIERDIQRVLPTAWTRLRRPRNLEGEWWLDAKKDKHVVTIQWSPRRGFGISASALEGGYGEGPEETETSRERATARVLQLLRTRSHTAPPQSVLLRELRSLIGVTQEQLAEKLGVQQAAVSRLERREDMTLSSLKRFVAALGAKLEISIRTPSGDQLRLDEPSKAKHRASCSHVDSLAQVGSPPAELPMEDCRTWLTTFENEVRSRWSLSVSGLSFEGGCTETVAKSEVSTFGRIALDPLRSWSLSHRLLESTQKSHPFASVVTTFRTVLKHLIAHEVGHFVDNDALRAERAFRAFQHQELGADAVAGWLAGRAGDDALLGSTLSSHLGCRVFQCGHPTPEERSFAYLVGHLHGVREKESASTMNLLVIRTLDLERSRAFYMGLGLDLHAERHGEGRLHYSCNIAGTTIELYPATSRTGGVRLGLRLPAPRTVVEGLMSLGLLAERPRVIQRTPGPSVCVVKDPDGNAIELELEVAA